MVFFLLKESVSFWSAFWQEVLSHRKWEINNPSHKNVHSVSVLSGYRSFISFPSDCLDVKSQVLWGINCPYTANRTLCPWKWTRKWSEEINLLGGNQLVESIPCSAWHCDGCSVSSQCPSLVAWWPKTFDSRFLALVIYKASPVVGWHKIKRNATYLLRIPTDSLSTRFPAGKLAKSVLYQRKSLECHRNLQKFHFLVSSDRSCSLNQYSLFWPNSQCISHHFSEGCEYVCVCNLFRNKPNRQH